MKVDDDKKLEILTAMEMNMEMEMEILTAMEMEIMTPMEMEMAMEMAMMVSRCENLVAGIKRRMDGSGYRKMHLVHLGGFKHQPKDDGDGSKFLM